MSDQGYVWLRLSFASPYARAIGLRRGDALIALDAAPLTGTTRSILARLKQAPHRQLHLTFRRGGAQWDVICHAARLGRWIAEPEPTRPAALVADRGLRNWDIMADSTGRYDAQMQGPRILALLAPVYLVQMRLWGPLAVWTALTLLGLVLGAIWCAVLQVLLTLYVWQAGPALVRQDRQAQGYRLWRVMACRGEADLHNQMRQIAPHLRFAYAAATTAPARPANDPAI